MPLVKISMPDLQYERSGSPVWRTVLWIGSNPSVCRFVRDVCHTGLAYSSTDHVMCKDRYTECPAESSLLIWAVVQVEVLWVPDVQAMDMGTLPSPSCQ